MTIVLEYINDKIYFSLDLLHPPPPNSHTLYLSRMIKPPDRRAKEIIRACNNKYKKLDKVFAEEVVGNGENGVTGPFQTAHECFYWGQVIPICAGWFWEI